MVYNAQSDRHAPDIASLMEDLERLYQPTVKLGEASVEVSHTR
jgi:hypothetical protein